MSDPNKEHIEIAAIITVPVTQHINSRKPFIDSYVEKAKAEGKMIGGAEGEMMRKEAEKQPKDGDEYVIK